MSTDRTDGLDDALARLADIHAQVARGAHFQGYRAAPVAAMGMIALAAAAGERRVLAAFDASTLSPAAQHAVYWAAMAIVCASIAVIDLVRRYGRLPRRTTALALGQLLPAGFVGLVLGIVLWSRAEFLPGLWTMVFGLGVLASAPYLPHKVTLVALYYVAAGATIALAARAEIAPSPWTMGLTFGVGQVASAAALRDSATGREEGDR